MGGHGIITILKENEEIYFPDPRYASKEGLVAVNGDLSPERILFAYSIGIFPWYGKDEPILWWSPDPRMVLYLDKFKVHRSLKKIIKKDIFEVKFDTNFEEVIKMCATIKRKHEDETWILPEVIEAYTRLHHLGFAHSVETYLDGELVGGLYGVSIGKMFSGESMFSKVSNASKVALYYLVEKLKEWNFDFIDCQIPSEHFKKWGGIEVSRDKFLDQLEIAVKKETKIGKWEL